MSYHGKPPNPVKKTLLVVDSTILTALHQKKKAIRKISRKKPFHCPQVGQDAATEITRCKYSRNEPIEVPRPRTAKKAAKEEQKSSKKQHVRGIPGGGKFTGGQGW